MNKRKLLDRTRNNPRHVRFSDLLSLVEAHGFALDRVDGSHHVFKHGRVRELLNLQPRRDSKAMPYQVKEFLMRVEEDGLTMEEGA